MADKVNGQSAAVASMAADWPMLEALMGGTRAMRAAGEKLMPRFTLEHKDDYAARVAVSILFPAYRRTISVMVGKPFAKPVTLGEDVPPQIAGANEEEGWAEDIDREGVNLHTFAAEMFGEALAYGLAGILVEAPKPPASASQGMTRAVEKGVGMRPYWVRIKHHQILGWRDEVQNGKHVLTQLRLKETMVEPDGEWGEKTVERVRVLTPGAWALYEKINATAAGEDWVKVDEGLTGLDVIPFVPLYGWREGFMRGSPPLLDLAFMNVKHWQDSSDQSDGVMFARKRMVVMIGGGVDAEGNPIVASSNSVTSLPVGGDVKIVQGSAENVKIGRDELAALEEQMIQTGAELLTKKPGDRSATEAANDADANKSDLQRITETFEDSLDQALYLTALFAGLPDGGHAELFKEFGVSIDAVASAQVLRDMRMAGDLSFETYFAELQRRGYIAPDVDAQAERERIDEEGPALGTMTDPASDPADPVDPASDPNAVAA